MTIDTCAGPFTCPETDPFFVTKFGQFATNRYNDARQSVEEIATPHKVTEVLCGSFVERQQLREEVEPYVTVLQDSALAVEQIKKKLHEENARASSERIARIIAERFKSAREQRAA